jgi:MFS family permease
VADLSREATAVVLIDRAVYSMQWFVLAPATIAIVGTSPGWVSGLLPLAFILGAALSQLIGAEVASSLGARDAFLIGLSIVSLADLLVAFSRGVVDVIALRLLAGLGAGLFFSPAGYMLVYLGGIGTSAIMGLYNMAFELGGAMALAWGLVDGLVGWRPGTAIAGAIGLALAIASLVLINGNPRPSGPRDLLNLKWREVLLVGLAGAGAFGASYAFGSYLPTYAAKVFRASPYGSGSLTALSFIGGAVGGLSLLFLDLGSGQLAAVASLVASSLTYAALVVRPYGLFVVMSIVNSFLVNWAFSVYYAHVVERFGRDSSTTSLAAMNMVNMIGSLWVYPLSGIIIASDPVLFPAFLAASSAALSFLLLIRPRDANG